MSEEGRNGWRDYRPSKALWFWSCAGCVVATMAIGFTWGGWVTGSTAEQQVVEARDSARAQLAATICVARYVDAPDAAVQLAALKDESSWSRDDTIAKAGWTTPLGLDKPVSGAADICAERLVAMDLPAGKPVVAE